MAKYTNVGLLLQKHLAIDFLEEGDAEYLDFLLAAVESRIEKEIKQPLSEFVDDNGKLDPALVNVIFLQVGTLYANREAVAYTNAQHVPFTFGWMIQPFRKFS